MIKFSKIAFSTIAATIAVGLNVVPAFAYMHQEQSQSSSTKTSFNSSCDGNCGNTKVESTTTTEVNQSQSQSIGGGTHSYDDSFHFSYSRGRNKNKTWENRDGQAQLSWDFRGGTCTVRYTESTSRNWNYSTKANCDDAGITIGGLVKGRNYRFQVKQNDGGWTRTSTIKAW